MSTNLRKAQKHMQRATELLNQGQLAFGGPDGVETRAQKRQRKELEELEEKEALKKELPKKQKVEAEARLDLNKVSDQEIRNVTDHLDSCEDVCTLQGASKRFKDAEINEKLKQKLLLDPEKKWPEKKWTLFTACQKCQQGKIRLRSMPKKEHNTKLKKHDKFIMEKYNKKSLLPRDLALMNNIDIIVTITKINNFDDTIYLDCVLYKDVNGNFTQYNTNMKAPIEIGKEFKVKIQNINLQNEYFAVLWFDLFFCNAHQSWQEIQKRMDQEEFPRD